MKNKDLETGRDLLKHMTKSNRSLSKHCDENENNIYIYFFFHLLNIMTWLMR